MKNVIYSLLLLFMASCYMSKPLEREVHVRINSNIPVSIINNGSSNFTSGSTKETYHENFIAGLKSEFTTSKIIPDDVNPEFEIVVLEFLITESTKKEVVNDTTSDDHGKEFELTTLDFLAKGEVVRLKDGVKYTWSATKDKSEKVTSLRSGGQIVTGQNKEKNEYREKELEVADVTDLAQMCGRRSGVSIVKEITRALK